MSVIGMVSRFIMIEPIAPPEPATVLRDYVIHGSLIPPRAPVHRVAPSLPSDRACRNPRKPPVHLSKQIARLLHLALAAPEALRRSINHACSCEISRLVWSGMNTVAMKLTMAQAAM
jgi:hypothetical protein